MTWFLLPYPETNLLPRLGWFGNLSARGLQGEGGSNLSGASIAAEKIGFVSQNHGRRFSPLLLGRLPKAHAWSATVLVNELDPGGDDLRS